MAGGLINIATYGSNDLYLTGAPQITFFKVVYRRYTNFSIESIKIQINDNFGFGNESEVTLPRTGDLINKMFFEIDVPEVTFTKSDIGVTHVPATLDTEPQDNYDAVLLFMKLNAEAYRKAVETFTPENTTVNTMITEIRDVFTSADIGGSGSNADVINVYTALINSFIDAGLIPRIITNIEDIIDFADETPSITKDLLMIRIQIDRHYGDWLNVWFELTGNRDKIDIYNRMIGNVKEMTTFDKNAKPKRKLIVPLNFWFCKHNGLAFPLIAMQYNEIIIKMRLNSIEQCAYIEKVVDDDVQVSLTDLWENKGYFVSSYNNW